MQRWFARRRTPCLVAGSTYPDIALPHYDLDNRAICRHAAGILLRVGHRRLALLNRESRRAGDVDSERGFIEGVRRSPHRDATAVIAYHRDDVDSVARAVRTLLERSNPPTALVVSNSYAYLSTASVLAQRGLRVPQDISLISRDDDPFLASLVPEPARYRVDPHSFAKKIVGSLLQILNRSAPLRSPTPLLPKFAAGGSTSAPPPVRESPGAQTGRQQNSKKPMSVNCARRAASCVALGEANGRRTGPQSTPSMAMSAFEAARWVTAVPLQIAIILSAVS